VLRGELLARRGESRYRDRWLHVSPGLGHSKYTPFRVGCRPEATLIELRD
jgi:predicted MPP superfamily phosphohydrolase